MGKFSEVLFASDFDHTLTGPDNILRQQNVEAIRYFISEGGIFTVASGRSIPLFRKRAELVPVNAPCILYNGAACYDYRDGTLHYAHPLPDDTLELIRALRAFDPTVCVEIQGQEQHYVFGQNERRDAFLRSEGFTPVHVENDAPKPWMKLAVCIFVDASGQPAPEQIAHVQAVKAYLEKLSAGRFYVTRSMPYIIEVGELGYSKGTAARALANDYGRNTLVCAGDAPNDLAMLQEADIAFSPADRDPELALDKLISVVPCADGSVADAIAKLENML